MRKLYLLFICTLLLCPYLVFSQQNKLGNTACLIFYFNKTKHTSIEDSYRILIGENKNAEIKPGQQLHITVSLKEAVLLNTYWNGITFNTWDKIFMLPNDTFYYYVNPNLGANLYLLRQTKETALKDIKSMKINEIITVDFSNNASNSTKKSGSGFLVSQQGYVITNYHVISGTAKIRVRGVNGNKESLLSAKVLLQDSLNDLALLKLTDKLILDSVPYMFNKDIIEIGENIFVLGYPLTETMGEDIKLTNGIISSKSGFKGEINAYQISAPVQPGNSGGPLFDAKGNLVGIVNAKHSGAENAGYAIKTKYLLELLENLDVRIQHTQVNVLKEKPLPEQVKAIQNFVYIIEAE